MPKKVPNSYKVEKVNYDKVKHETSVDQSDRQVPHRLRQSGPTKVEMLISTRVRKISLLAFIHESWLLESYSL